MPYNTVTLRLLKSIMNLKFVTGVHAYLTSYLWTCREWTCEKSTKRGLWKSLFSIGNILLKKCEVSTFEETKGVLTLPMGCSNIDDFFYVSAGLKK